MKKQTVTSVHEAAHALTAHLLGEKVNYLESCGDVGSVGIFFSQDKVIRTCVLMAGHEAEVLWFSRDVKIVPYDDWKSLEKIKTSNIGANIIREPLIKFLKANKKTIFNIANVLDVRGKMSRRIFLRTIKKTYLNHKPPKIKPNLTTQPKE